MISSYISLGNIELAKYIIDAISKENHTILIFDIYIDFYMGEIEKCKNKIEKILSKKANIPYKFYSHLYFILSLASFSSKKALDYGKHAYLYEKRELHPKILLLYLLIREKRFEEGLKYFKDMKNYEKNLMDNIEIKFLYFEIMENLSKKIDENLEENLKTYKYDTIYKLRILYNQKLINYNELKDRFFKFYQININLLQKYSTFIQNDEFIDKNNQKIETEIIFDYENLKFQYMIFDNMEEL